LRLATYSTQPLAGILPNGARTFLPIPKYPAIAWPTFRVGLYAAPGKWHGLLSPLRTKHWTFIPS
jgi:hypothetical protein